MYQIPLTSLPNQTVSFNIDGAYWQVHIYQSLVHMCADILRNGSAIASGIRCFSGVPLLQYSYMTMPNFGNFIFDSDVNFTLFGSSCNLYYLEQIELQQFNQMILTGA